MASKAGWAARVGEWGNEIALPSSFSPLSQAGCRQDERGTGAGVPGGGSRESLILCPQHYYTCTAPKEVLAGVPSLAYLGPLKPWH